MLLSGIQGCLHWLLDSGLKIAGMTFMGLKS
jgi:hypothetical protein